MVLISRLRLLLSGLVISLPSWSVHAERDSETLPIIFHVASNERGEPVADADYLAAAVAAANEIFAPLALHFERAETRELPPRHANVVSRADRDALLPYVEAGAIHCMVVGSLMDVDEPGRVRRGVHWYARHEPRPHLIILSAIASPRVLAHELGHYLGLPEHSPQAGNVMSYAWTDAVPSFDPQQTLRVRRTVARMRRQREL
jgi:hypothetical protein